MKADSICFVCEKRLPRSRRGVVVLERAFVVGGKRFPRLAAHAARCRRKVGISDEIDMAYRSTMRALERIGPIDPSTIRIFPHDAESA